MTKITTKTTSAKAVTESTTKKIKDIAFQSASKSKLANAIQEWSESRGFPEQITYSKKHNIIDLKLEIEVQDIFLSCHVLGSPKDMMLGLAVFPYDSVVPEEKKDVVQKWTLWRNSDLHTGSFALTDDELQLQYFNCINFTGVKRIETALIENMFSDAISAYAEFGKEYFELIK